MRCEELTAGLTSFNEIYPGMSLTIVAAAIVFIGPLFEHPLAESARKFIEALSGFLARGAG